MNTVLCFYHNDMDGHCAAAIVKQAVEETDASTGTNTNLELYEMRYGYDSEKFEEFLTACNHAFEAYIVDFRLKPEDMQKLLNMCETVTWIDHHATSIRDRDNLYHNEKSEFHDNDGRIEIFLDDTKAGCELTWEYLYPKNPIPRVVHHVGRYDVWDHKHPETLPMQRGLALTDSTNPADPIAFSMWKTLFLDDRTGANKDFNAVDQVLNIGVIGEAMKATYDDYMARDAFLIEDWEGLCVVALNAKPMDSYVLEGRREFFDEFEPEAILWYYQSPYGWKYSIRSYPGTETDVSKIAEKFGGGGHIGAAGFFSEELLITHGMKADLKKLKEKNNESE